jgi:hypothetical protein
MNTQFFGKVKKRMHKNPTGRGYISYKIKESH